MIEKEKINVAIVDDQELFLDLTKKSLESSELISVVGAFQTGNAFFSFLQNPLSNNVDVILLDVEIPSSFGDDGFEIAQKIRKNHPNMKIISMSVNTQSYVIRKLIHEIKVDSFIDKNKSNLYDLIATIQVVMDGHFYVEKELEQKALRILDIEKLTPRERQIVEMIIKNHSTKKIASILKIGLKTADNHRQNIFLKMKCHKVSELAEKYYRYVYLQDYDTKYLPNFKKSIT